ncbi:hypothetical protein MycrhDRAFT_5607 [Mycolicibacterium rhodesiae JS60]|nr:hypothetical protein MycrhDRAFT_5607 [Mycolicibacterium rhodesiae JS60]
MMVTKKRPWKVRFHFDGTKAFSDDESLPELYVIDTSRPIDGMSSHLSEAAAGAAARRTSRNGGTAEIVFRDPVSGATRTVRSFAPYEVALAELDESWA